MSIESLFARIDRVLERVEAARPLAEVVAEVRAITRPDARLEDLPVVEFAAGDLDIDLSESSILEALDSIDDYGIEAGAFDWIASVRKTKPLTSDDQVSLAMKIEAGVLAQAALGGVVQRAADWRDRDLRKVARAGSEALEAMTVGNLGLVLYWAIRSRSLGTYSMEDRFQDGVPGLIRAIEGWDHRRGYAFSTYATWHIRRQIIRQMQDLAYGIRAPIHVHEEWNASRRTGESMSASSEAARRLVVGTVSWDVVKEIDCELAVPRTDDLLDVLTDVLSQRQVLEAAFGPRTDQQRDVIAPQVWPWRRFPRDT